MKILNTWTSNALKAKYYDENNLVYENGDYRIFKQWNESFIYSFKNIAFNNLAGLNKPHLDRVAKRERPEGKYGPDTFLYDSAVRAIGIGTTYLQIHKN